jgi:hypothetical protein
VLTRLSSGWKIAHEHFSRFPDWQQFRGEKTDVQKHG